MRLREYWTHIVGLFLSIPQFLTDKMNEWAARIEANNEAMRTGRTHRLETKIAAKLERLQFEAAADAQAKRTGYYWTQVLTDVLWRIWKYVLVVLVVIVIGQTVLSYWWQHSDGSDLVMRGAVIERSGMKVRTDWGTGCQFLESAEGHLTPRIAPDSEGGQSQVCFDLKKITIKEIKDQTGDWHKVTK